MEELIDVLVSGNHSLVVDNGEIRTFDGRGVSDLYRMLVQDPGFLDRARIADKVVGKGAAALMILGGVNEVYAGVISDPAFALFEKSEVKVSFGKRVEHIINRKGDDICPVEKLCAGCTTPEECLPLIKGFVQCIIHNA